MEVIRYRAFHKSFYQKISWRMTQESIDNRESGDKHQRKTQDNAT